VTTRAAPPLPDIVRRGLRPGHVLVFGSNLEGIHGAGSALIARRFFGAQPRVGEGRTGRCYALPTKRTPYERMELADLQGSVSRFLKHAAENPRDTFVLVEVGCRLAGFTVSEVAELFRSALSMPNVFLPYSFLRHLGVVPALTGLAP
jgi:hypothetical protein